MKGKMKAAWLRGLRNFQIVEVDMPRIKSNQVLVKVSKIGICGSDRGMWDEHHFFNELYKWEDFEPGEHGHESVGRVVEVGKDVKGIKEGDQVVRLNLYDSMDLKMANFAEYAVSDCCIPCNGANPDVMCFTDPVMVALNHIHHANLSPGDTAVVMGQGLLGLIVTQLLIHNHVDVIATDVSQKRLNFAQGFGAKVYHANDPDMVKKIKELATNIQAVIECSGSDEAIDSACHLLSRGGSIVVMGATRTRITFNYTQLRIKGASVKFPMNRVNHKDNWLTAARLLMRGEIEVKSFIDKRDKIENIQWVLEHYDDEWIRVILDVGDSY
ncbi:MAG: zinc-binding dehydrogenase [Planctomycetes bacterium]|nr:zinc-binding dehydrogenase [Planctomycetota bacterium]